MEQNLKKQGIVALFWDFIGKIAIQGSSFVVSIFLARLLEPSDFGLIAMVMVVIVIVNIFSDIGLSSALVQRRRVLDIHYNSVFYFNVVVAFILTLITFVGAPYLASFYNNNQLTPIVRVVSIIFILGSLNIVHISQFRRDLDFKSITKVSFISSLIAGIVGVIMAFKGFGVWSLVAQQLLSSIISIILVWSYSSWRPKLQFSFKALKLLWGFGFRMFLSSLLDHIFSKIDYVIIGKLFTPAKLGYFQRAKSLDTFVINYASGSLMSVLFPIMSKIQNNLQRFQEVTIKSLGVITFVTFLLLGNLYLVSKEIIILLFSDKWIPSIEIFKILVLSGFTIPVSSLLVSILSSRGNSKAFLRLEIYKKLVFGLNLYIGFLWGIKGYLYGLVIASIIAVYLNIVFASKEIHLSQIDFIKPIIIEALIAIFITIFVLNFTYNFHNNFLNLIVKSSEYTLLFVLTNKFLNTASYQYIQKEFILLIDKIKRK